MQSIRLTNTTGIIFKINYRIEKRKSKIDNGQLHYLIGNQDDDFEIYFLMFRINDFWYYYWYISMVKKQTPKEKELLVIEYYQEGKTYAEIVSRLGLSRSTIDCILTRHNIKRRGNIKVFIAYGSKNGKAKLTESDVLSISQLFNSGVTRKEIAKQFSVSLAAIDRIVNNQTWKHVKCDHFKNS